jgi:spore germination cell wall hydrolase CwlJ-like protein
MDYTKAYLKLANYQPETIREEASKGGLGGRRREVTRTPLDVPEQEDIAQKYYGMVKSIRREPPKEEELTDYLDRDMSKSEEAPKASPRPKGRPIRVEDMDERELLAKTIQAEAGNQNFKGKLAVGEVISNRVASGRWGGSLESVILADGQFSAWNSVTGYAGGEQGQDMNKMRPSKEAYKAADAILSGEYQPITGGALNYYAIIPGVSEKPAWAKENFKKIGDHYFGTA